MHVLLVAYHYPPDRAVGALRPARMAEALRAAGHRVSVITACLPGEVQPTRPAPPGMAVFPVASWISPREVVRNASQTLRRGSHRPGSSTEAPSADGDGTALPTPGPLWKRTILSLLWLPDDRQGFIPAAVAQAKVIHRSHPVDLLITSAPPFSTHLAGLRIQDATGARWVADFRDPWVENPWKPDAVRTAATDRLERWMERRVLERAELVTSASEGIQQILAKHLARATGKMQVIRNGIESLRQRPPRDPDAPFRILHMGTFYQGRDPRPFLSALAEIVRRYPERRIVVDIVGKSRSFRGEPIPGMVSALGLDGIVTFHDFVPRETVIEMAAGADLLLLLAQEQPDQVPQKLYEYLGTRVPILAFADEGGETARMLEQAGGHYIVIGNDDCRAVEALEAALAGPLGQPAGDPAVLSEWTVDGQLTRLIGAVGG